jgi:hypothetical protein
LDRSEVRTIPLDILKKFKIHFSIIFFVKWRPSGYTLAPDFLQEEDFLQSNLLRRGGKRPQEERKGYYIAPGLTPF